MTVKPYQISVSDEALEDLSQRLAHTKFPDQLEDEDCWQFGVPVSDLRPLVTHWKDGFVWRRAETTLNRLPHFRTGVEVDGFGEVGIHWPGSFIEVTKLLPLLEGSGNVPAFHLVAPSLPNFGFSSGINKRGFVLTKYAEPSFTDYILVTQGGDWGFSITRAIGLQYPNHCMASHINLILARAPKLTRNPLLTMQHAIFPYDTREKAGLERSAWFDNEGYGYNILQSSKPQTIGYALTDSPVALLAWIYEKLHDWTDGYQWTDDEILTWVSIYWFSTAGPAASVRIYHEATRPQPYSDVTTSTLRQWIPHVKLGIAHFPRDITVVPKTWAATLGPVVLQSEHPKGGHFAAWEVPEAIVGDLHKMYGKGGPCYGVLPGRSGY